VTAKRHAQPLPVIDVLIAATARVHGLTVVTRNVKDFELAGVQVLNPFVE
jgi:predicted nucleic acid-binding protein